MTAVRTQSETSPDDQAAFALPTTTFYQKYVLVALLVIYIFNVIDRILLALVQDKVKVDLHISDFQLGLMGGPAFAVLYALLGIPIAHYSERTNRVTVVALGAAIWSAATTYCGFAQNFVQLLIARIWVGIGEAACIPPSHSVLSDYYPSQRRGSALAIYGLGIPIGTVLASLGGGWIAQHLDWRSAFWFLGVPGVVAAILLKISVKEPARTSEAVKYLSLGTTLRALSRKRSFWHMTFGGALLAIFAVSFVQFLVSFFVRSYSVPFTTAAYAFGAISGFAVASGTFLGGFLSDRLAVRHPRILSWLPATGAALAAPIYLIAFMQHTFFGTWIVLMVAPIFHYLYFSPLFNVAQSVAEPRMRATSSALMLLFVTLIGYGLGPPLVGAIADHFSTLQMQASGLTFQGCMSTPRNAPCVLATAYGLRIALASSTAFVAWGAVHFWLAGRTLERERFS